LTITGSDALVSLDGFEYAVESIQNLEVYSNLKLKDFSGMLSPSGKIKSSMQLVGNTSLASLEGLSFASDIPFDILIEDNSLQDISALKGIEKNRQKFDHCFEYQFRKPFRIGEPHFRG
jgi:hypothetical protein